MIRLTKYYFTCDTVDSSPMHCCCRSGDVLTHTQLCEFPNIEEAAVLSTCNRFEVYIASHDGHAAIRDVMTCLQQRSGLSQGELRRNLFMLSLDDTVWHLLRVSAGLDSLVVGEGQILSQVRRANDDSEPGLGRNRSNELKRTSSGGWGNGSLSV